MRDHERGRLIPFRLPPPKKIVPLGTEDREIVYSLRAALDILDGSIHLAERVEWYAQITASLWSELLELVNAHGVDSAEARAMIARAAREEVVVHEGAEDLRAARRTLTDQVGARSCGP